MSLEKCKNWTLDQWIFALFLFTCLVVIPIASAILLLNIA